jgi:cupin 2 domain-containing protein
MIAKNLYKEILDLKVSEKEVFDTLCTHNNLRIERIISKGHITPPGVWLDQEGHEWVILLRGKASIEFEYGLRVNLKSGDYFFIPAGHKHRVAFTSKKPFCVWLAVHFK